MHENEEVVNRIEGLLAVEDGEPAQELQQAQEPPQEPEQPVQAQQEEGQPESVQAEQEKDPEPKAAEEKTEEEVIASTIGDLAEYLSQQGVAVETADLYNLKLPVTNAKGEREDITIGQWKDEYQASIQAKAEAERSAAEHREITHKLQQNAQAYQTRLNELAALASVDEAQLAEEAKAVNWNELRQDDPAEYAVRRQEFEDRGRAIQARRAQIGQYMNQQHQQSMQERQQYMTEMVARETAMLPQVIPAWSDPKVAEAERDDLVQYLGKSGYTPQEIGSIHKSRDVLVARKAMLYDRQQKANPEAKKVLKIGAKVLKPGAQRSKSQVQNGEYREDLQRFRKGGGRDEHLAVDLVDKHLLGEF